MEFGFKLYMTASDDVNIQIIWSCFYGPQVWRQEFLSKGQKFKGSLGRVTRTTLTKSLVDLHDY